MPKDLSTKPKLSACLIVKNEAQNISKTLESIKGLVDEVCLVDTGSTDETVQIVRSMGIEPFFFEWIDDFAAAKNFSKSKATGDWILFIDGDEVIDKKDHAKILDAIKDPKAQCYRLPKRSYVNDEGIFKFEPNDGSYPQGEGFKGWLTESNDLLFKNRDDIYFEDCIHETVTKSVINAGLEIADLSGAVIHNYGRHDMSSKGDLYSRLIRKRAELQPKDPIAWHYLGLIEDAAGNCEVAVDCFKEARSLGYNEDSLYHMALSYMNRKNSVEAEKCLLEYLKINPYRLEAWEELIRIFAFQKRLDKVGNTPKVLTKNGVSHPRLMRAIAGAYYFLGYPAVGQTYWDRANNYEKQS